MEPKRIRAVFYWAASGAEPVRDWLLAISVEDRRAIGYDIATAEFGWPVGMPVCRPMDQGLRGRLPVEEMPRHASVEAVDPEDEMAADVDARHPEDK